MRNGWFGGRNAVCRRTRRFEKRSESTRTRDVSHPMARHGVGLGSVFWPRPTAPCCSGGSYLGRAHRRARHREFGGPSLVAFGCYRRGITRLAPHVVRVHVNHHGRHWGVGWCGCNRGHEVDGPKPWGRAPVGRYAVVSVGREARVLGALLRARLLRFSSSQSLGPRPYCTSKHRGKMRIFRNYESSSSCGVYGTRTQFVPSNTFRKSMSAR